MPVTTTPAFAEDGPVFHCSHCSSERVASTRLRPLNYFPDAAGKLQPTVTQAELDAIADELCDPENFRCYCFACKKWSNMVLDSALLAEYKPGEVS